MSEPFDPAGIRILVPVEVAGPRRRFRFEFALDSGATRTVIRPRYLERLGYDLATASPRSPSGPPPAAGKRGSYR